jgi:penicillin-binding protein 1B
VVAKKRKTKKIKKAVAQKTVRSSSARSHKQSRLKSWQRIAGSVLLRLSIFLAVILLAYTAYLDIHIRKQFEGQKWALPAHVYTRPMELYVGQTIQRDVLQAELDELGYKPVDQVVRIGEYHFSAARLELYQREFRFWDEYQEAQRLVVHFVSGKVSKIESGGQLTEIIRLEPRLFGSVSPLTHEDRTLLRLEETPQTLIDALLAVEDRQFFSHFGVNPLGILRAMIRNVSAGRVVQGGSTLTQQLVKNYYLNSERTIKRKITEAIMAVLLEIHYSKQEILQAYLNDINISQAGNRAIHGFALGSQYFFGRPLQELELPELALLVGIIKGPSFYHPIRNPERALNRRNVVLKTMLDTEIIDLPTYESAMKTGLSTSKNATNAAPLSYPSFMGYVRKNLKNDYLQEDLLNDGLQIYTTLNPRIQNTLESAVTQQLKRIESQRGLTSGTLQVAAVVVRTDNGEVSAMVGDRTASFSGFNRAIDARRPVGSLLKPFVYLTALESPQQFSLASMVKDELIVVSQKGSPDWRPQNYDGIAHGDVMLVDALARSYNLATVNLGMQLGVSNVAATIRRVGVDIQINELPSLLLGAVPMSVVEVAQLYLTLASDGFKTPVKAIRSVLSHDNVPLARYPLTIEQVIEPEFNSLINYALQEVVRTGTARTVKTGFQYDYGLAGKTGTTDDYRDSWFAGFSGNYLTVVWVGRDDNKPTGLTGASGAAKIWAKTMQGIPMRRFEPGYHSEIINQSIAFSIDPMSQDCSGLRELPILQDSLPLQDIPCADKIQYDSQDSEQQHFEPRNEKVKPKSKSFWQRIFG